MAKTKKETAQKIRSSITSAAVGEPLTGNKLKETTASNVAVANHVLKISDRIEKLTEHERKFFTDLIDEVKKIPEDTEEFKKQQKAIYENLIKASAIIAKEAGEETDAEKKKNLEEILEALKKRGKDIEKELPRKPQTFKERLAAQQFGGDPDEVSKKGYFGTMFAQSKRELFGAPEPSFDERLDAEQLAAGIEQIPDKSLKEKTDDNTRATSILESSLSALLKEVTIIRKITEGSLKFDARLKGSPYYQEDAEGKKRSVSKNIARTAGTGLYTKDELGEKLELTKTETKKKKLSELEGMAGDVVDLEKKSSVKLNTGNLGDDIDTSSRAAEKGATLAVADVSEKENDINENLERATDIDTDPTDETRFKTSGIDEETEKEGKVEANDKETGASGGFIPPLFGGRGRSRRGRGAGGRLKGFMKGAGRAAKVGGRLLGKVAVPLAIGMSAYDAYKGFKADSDAPLSERLKNAGSSVASGLTFGLAGSSPEEIAARKAEKTSLEEAKTPTEIPQSTQASLEMPKTPAAVIPKVEKTQNVSAKTIETADTVTKQQMPSQNITNVTNNNSGSGQQSQTPAPQTSVLPVRTSDTSFIRYQDKRMTRVL